MEDRKMGTSNIERRTSNIELRTSRDRGPECLRFGRKSRVHARRFAGAHNISRFIGGAATPSEEVSPRMRRMDANGRQWLNATGRGWHEWIESCPFRADDPSRESDPGRWPGLKSPCAVGAKIDILVIHLRSLHFPVPHFPVIH
jgi:hypothetical protein